MFQHLYVLYTLLMCSLIAGQSIDQTEPTAPETLVYPSDVDQQSYESNGCLREYLRCPNLCNKTGQNCCYCQECFSKFFGLTQTCTCCPKGYKCCPTTPPPVGMRQKCCPTYTDCGPADSKYCVQYSKPIYNEPVCQNCNAWTWPPRIYTQADIQKNENITAS